MQTIMDELKTRVDFFREDKKLIEAQRIEERNPLRPGDDPGTGILQRHRELFPSSDRAPGRPAAAHAARLFRPADYLMFIDESHIAVPQIQAMYKGDRSRKETLVTYGFRLPLGTGQPSAAFRRMARARQPGCLRFRHPRPTMNAKKPATA